LLVLLVRDEAKNCAVLGVETDAAHSSCARSLMIPLLPFNVEA
jgi:hypothetical protein